MLLSTILVGLWLAGTAFAESAVLECTADTWIASYSRKTTSSNGSARTLRLKGSEAVLLLSFRVAVIEGWKIHRATLLIHRASGGTPKGVGLSAVSIPWSEASPGAARPNSRYAFVPVTEAGEGWLRVEVPPALIEQLRYGLAMIAGQNKAYEFHSRETVQYSPYLLVEGSRR